MARALARKRSMSQCEWPGSAVTLCIYTLCSTMPTLWQIRPPFRTNRRVHGNAPEIGTVCNMIKYPKYLDTASTQESCS